MYSSPSATSWASQIFSNIVFGVIRTYVITDRPEPVPRPSTQLRQDRPALRQPADAPPIISDNIAMWALFVHRRSGRLPPWLSCSPRRRQRSQVAQTPPLLIRVAHIRSVGGLRVAEVASGEPYGDWSPASDASQQAVRAWAARTEIEDLGHKLTKRDAPSALQRSRTHVDMCNILDLSCVVDGSTTSKPSGDNGQESCFAVVGVLEVVGKIGVEGDAIALEELVALPVAHQHRRAFLDKRGLTAAWLVHWWIVSAPVAPPGRAYAARAPSAGRAARRSSPRRMPTLAVAPTSRSPARHRHRAGLVEAQQLGEAQVQARGDPRRDRQRGTRLPTLDLREHRRAYPAALSQISQRQRGRLAQGLHTRPDHRRVERFPAWIVHRDFWSLPLGLRGRHTSVRYHRRSYWGAYSLRASQKISN